MQTITKTSQAGIDLIKYWETFEPIAYKPTPDDVWTIGWGTTRINGKPVQPGMAINEEYAEKLLRADVEEAETAVANSVVVPLTQNQFDALVVFTYNVGIGAFTSSTLLKLLNAGQYADVPTQMKRWVKQKGKVLNGLVRRRESEITLWNTP